MTKRDTLLATLVSIGLAALLLPFARIGVDPHHDGLMLKAALDVLSGQTLFRDTFMQYGALSCYLHVVALFIHPSLLCLKLMTVAAYAGTLFVLFAAWRLVLPRSLTLLACGLFILFFPAYEKDWLNKFWILLPWSSVFAMFFQAVALYALLRVIRDEQAQRWGLLLGMACAAVFWCRQPVGVLLTGTVVVIGAALHWTGWQPRQQTKREILLWTLAGLAGVNFALLANLWFSGALPEWWYQNVIWPRKWAAAAGRQGLEEFIWLFLHPAQAAALAALGIAAVLPHAVRRFRPALPVRGMWIYYAILAALCLWQKDRLLQAMAYRDGGWSLLLPAVIVIQAVISIRAGFGQRAAARPVEYYLVAALAAVSLSSLPQYYPVSDAWHVFWALGPAFGLCVYAVWRWSGTPVHVIILLVIAALVPSAWTKVRLARELLAQPLVTIERPAVLRGMRVPPAKAAAYAQILSVFDPIQRHQPDIRTVLTGNDALYLCFTNNHTNPSPYFVTWLGLADATASQARWNYIERFRPVMILHQANWPAVNDFYRRARYVPLLYVADEALEIAVPQELADAMGLKVYGGGTPAAPAPSETPKP